MNPSAEFLIVGAMVLGLIVLVLSVGMNIISWIKSIASHQIEGGKMLNGFVKHHSLKADYFDDQAKSMQKFLDKFLGGTFNVQCNFMRSENLYKLWIWKIHETREMGVYIEAIDTPGLIEEFMLAFYRASYFTEVNAFPKE